MHVDIDFMLIVLLICAIAGLVFLVFMREILRVQIKYLNTLDDNDYGAYIIQFLHSRNISVCKCIGDSYFKQHNIVSAVYRKFNLAIVNADNWEEDSTMILHHMINGFVGKFLSEALIMDSNQELVNRNFIMVADTALKITKLQSDPNDGKFNTADMNGMFMLCYIMKTCNYETSKIWYIFCVWRFIMGHRSVKDFHISYSDFARFVLYLNQKLMDLNLNMETDDSYVHTVDLNGEMDEDACVNLAFNAISA